jgi:predicted secreted hydrolase
MNRVIKPRSTILKFTLLLGSLLLPVLALAACDPNQDGVQSRLIAPVGSSTGFTRAEAPTSLSFPVDHGPHPDFQTEWWYLTGNLQTADGRHFGYQLTFFRRALVPPTERLERTSEWATDQVYMAHLALTDVANRDHRAVERFARGAAGLAGATGEPFAVWLENWRLESTAPDRYQIEASADGFSLALRLTDSKGPILQGDQGYSRKGPEPGNASFYYSLTRLETSGTVTVENDSLPVDGLSWMDHEYSTSALTAGQVGWDWFSLQLDDGTDVMVFQIRREDGSVDPFSSGTLVQADGNIQPLTRDDFEIEVLDRWRSPDTNARYPSRWRITVPSTDMTLVLDPRLADQEMDVSYSYWEGAVQVEGEQAGSAVQGDGYVELTGYAESMAGQF